MCELDIRFWEGDKEKAAFKTNMGLYQPEVMPFGLCNTPAVFQCMMNTRFMDITATGEVIIYMDDILITTRDDLEHHRKIVSRVLEWLQEIGPLLETKQVPI